MKIAMMVRGYIPVPRPKDMIYAPIDLAVSVVDGLIRGGHNVSFFGPQGTHIPGAKIYTRHLRALVHNQREFSELTRDTEKLMHYVPELWDKRLACDMFRRAEKGEFDLLHFQHPEVAMPLATRYPTVPVVYTLHDPIYPWYRELFELYNTPNQHFISISDNQRRDAPDLPYARTVYNGVDLKQFPFSEDHEDYLLIVGRVIPEKGIKEAIKIAQETGLRLFIIGPVYEQNQGYFNQYIKPHLNDKILYLGFIEHDQLVKYYQKARALLMPVQWEEPFGLSMIEAMACGTPVVALRRGSVAEVVADGKTGYIVDSITEMIEALGKIDRIKPRDCRRHIQRNFSVNQMVTNYEAAYKDILQKHRHIIPGTKRVKTHLKHLPGRLKSTIKGK